MNVLNDHYRTFKPAKVTNYIAYLRIGNF